MRSAHAITATCAPQSSFHSTIGTQLSALLSTATGISRRLQLMLRQHMTMRRIERFSDHRLHDIGFERDWDGSLIACHK
jgi:hypothetical protein